MAANFVKKNGKLSSFVALAFRKGLEYRYLSASINSVNDASSSSYTTLIRYSQADRKTDRHTHTYRDTFIAQYFARFSSVVSV